MITNSINVESNSPKNLSTPNEIGEQHSVLHPEVILIKEEIVSEDYYQNEIKGSFNENTNEFNKNNEQKNYSKGATKEKSNFINNAEENELHCELIIKEEEHEFSMNEEEENIQELNKNTHMLYTYPKITNENIEHSGHIHFESSKTSNSLDKHLIKNGNQTVISSEFQTTSTNEEINVMNSNYKQFKCDYCEKCYSKNIYLKEHIVIHPEYKPLKYDKFGQGVQLITHKNVHTKFKTSKCDECEMNLDSKECNMNGLYKSEVLKCAKCSYNYNQKKVLEKDVKIAESKPYKCDKCEKNYATKKSLYRHDRTHTEYKPYNCDKCEKSFACKSKLTRHIIIHTDSKMFKCDDCEKSFISKEYLLKHAITHSNSKQFKCEVCEKGFNRKGDLKKHIMIHTGDKPFKCDVCEKSFNRNSELVKHYRTHTMEKPYVCEICKKCFGRKYTLNLHLKTHNVFQV